MAESGEHRWTPAPGDPGGTRLPGFSVLPWEREETGGPALGGRSRVQRLQLLSAAPTSMPRTESLEGGRGRSDQPVFRGALFQLRQLTDLQGLPVLFERLPLGIFFLTTCPL